MVICQFFSLSIAFMAMAVQNHSQKSSKSSLEIWRIENRKRSYFITLLSQKGKTKERLQCDSGLSESTVKKFIYYKFGFQPKTTTLKKLAIALRLSISECEVFFMNYGLFLQKEENEDFIIQLTFQSQYQDLKVNNQKTLDGQIKAIIEKNPQITQKEISILLGVNVKTLYRHFKKMDIKNLGSKKNPNYFISK